MSVTYGFYNSIEHDRVYDAVQMSSIFDGIINDGIYQSIGNRFIVSAYQNMTIHVGAGRAWFNHTWTLNDSVLPLEVEASEILLNRIDTVVIEVNTTDAVRANTIKIIKGTPASSPVRPMLTNSSGVYQYPLADIYVGKAVSEIKTANITNRVGTDTPFVTGILQVLSINDLVAQWQAQWDQDFNAYKDNVNTAYASYLHTMTEYEEESKSAWDAAIADYQAELETEYQSYVTDVNRLKTEGQTSYDEFVTDLDNYESLAQSDFEEWFEKVKGLMDGDTAGHVINLINQLEEDVTTEMLDYRDYVRIDRTNHTVTIGRETSPITLVVSETGVKVIQNGAEIAYVEDRTFYASNLNVLSKLVIGKSAWITEQNAYGDDVVSLISV